MQMKNKAVSVPRSASVMLCFGSDADQVTLLRYFDCWLAGMAPLFSPLANDC